MAENHACRCQARSINMLSDDVLLSIFDFYLDEASDKTYLKESIERWQSLAHVCRRWRSTVFGSPRRLNLRIGCTHKTPLKDLLDIWPALPLIICGRAKGSVDNVTAILEHRDRVRQINLWKLPSSHLEKVLAAMQVPFPELTHLDLRSHDETVVPDVPDSFLGGSAPRLEVLSFNRVPFPGLPKLLLSATHLVSLRIHEIPHQGYFSPEAIVTALSALTRLRFLSLKLRCPSSRPNRKSRRPPPKTRAVLPIVTFSFKGAREYFEDIVARIDVPQINELSINFFYDVEFGTHLIQLIGRTPTLGVFETARLLFMKSSARVELLSQTPGSGVLAVSLSCSELEWQISALEQACTSSLPLLSSLEDLYISEHKYPRLCWPDNIESTPWLELLHLFTSVKNLYLSGEVAPRIVPALQDPVGGTTTEVLPSLQNIFLEERLSSGPVQEGIAQIVAERQIASHPIAVSHWKNPLK
ncbi:hypothetical protein DFH94DRAFT_334183 [Russula ochroleuca]|uniref:F-box domain-containing protein n=1 Tax=Russula ochroleuca TaxID=152965 RepID=A0A9P5N252_9AGAM|nr:hypothetical protein DFH94DRAFT_334183 [Russula ochroleuca]